MLQSFASGFFPRMRLQKYTFFLIQQKENASGSKISQRQSLQYVFMSILILLFYAILSVLFRGANAHFIYFRILVRPKRVCCRCIAFLSHQQSFGKAIGLRFHQWSCRKHTSGQRIIQHRRFFGVLPYH